MSRIFSKGILRENPVFVVLLGLCPALGVTTRVQNAAALGLGVVFVLAASSFVVSLLRYFIPERVRVPANLVVVATFTTLLDLLLQAYAPTVSRNLGIFVPLIAVNCLILGRAKAFAREHFAVFSLLDGLGHGLGFALALILIALVREVLGNGTITLFPFGKFDGIVDVPWLSSSPIRIFGLSAGAFIVVGYLKALFDIAGKRLNRSEKKEETQ